MIFSLLFLITSCTPSNGESVNTVEETITETFERFQLKEPYPIVEIVSPYHWSVRGDVKGRAVRYNTGREEIYLQRDNVRTQSKLEDLLDHEVSHIKAWREHGENISSHGFEYNKICRHFSRRKTSCSARG